MDNIDTNCKTNHKDKNDINKSNTKMVFVYDNNLRIVKIINPQQNLFLMHQKDNLIGVSIDELVEITEDINKEQAQIIVNNVKKAHNEGTDIYFEYLTTHKDNSTTYSICYIEHGSNNLLYVNVLNVDEKIIIGAREQFANYIIDLTMNNISAGVIMRKFRSNGNKEYILFNDICKEIYQNKDVLQSRYWDQEADDLADELTLRSNQAYNYESNFRNNNNEIIKYLFTTKKKISTYDNSYYIVTTIIDITKRKQTEILIEDQFNLLDNIYKHLPVGIELYGAKGNLITMNKRNMDIYEINSDKNIIGSSIFDNPYLPQELILALEEGRDYEAKSKYYLPEPIETNISDDSYNCFKWLLLKSVILRDKNDNISGYLLICEDITETYTNSILLSDSQRDLQMALNAGSISTWKYDIESQSFSTIIGNPLSSKWPLLKDIDIIMHKDDIPVFMSLINDISNGNKNYAECIFRSKEPGTDNYRYYEIYMGIRHNSNGKKIITGTERDITDKYIKENEINNQRLMLESILNQTPCVMFIKDIEDDFKYIVANKLFCDYSKKSPQEIIGKTDFEIFNNKEAKKFRQDDIRAINSISEYSFIEHVHWQGKEIVWHTTKAKLKTYDGKTLLIGIALDVTESVNKQRVLKEYKFKSDMVIDASGLKTWEYCCDTETLTINYKEEKLKKGIESLKIFTNIVHKDDTSNVEKAWNIISNQKNESFSFDLRYRLAKQDQWIYTTIGGFPISVDKNANIIRYLGFIKDNTKLAILNEDLDKTNTLLNSFMQQIPLSLFVKDIDNDYKYVIANDILKQISKVDNINFIGKTDYELFDKHSADKIRNQDLETVNNFSGELINKQVKIQTDLNSTRYFEINNKVINTTNGHRFIIGLVKDITEREENRIELEYAKEKAEQSDKLKSAFLANMSHEIRTPLNAIVGFSELLMTEEDKHNKEEYNKLISTNSQLLLHLISDILDLSKVEAGMIDFKKEVFDLIPYLNNLANTYKQKCIEKGLDFILESKYSSCIVKYDKNRLAQVLSNYVTNAIKYTPSGTIKLGYILENRGLKFYVTDTGIGIPQNKHSKVFHRFQKLDEFAQGTGLGLSICKALTETDGGKVGFESKEGIGSTFWAWKPCKIKINPILNQSTQETLETVNPTLLPDTNNVRVLVAEDNESNFLLLKHILKGFNIYHVTNGADAVIETQNKTYDIILMDIQMPILNGLDATSQIRKFNPSIPIIAVTANAYGADKDEALNAGCSAFITKPLNREELYKTISQQLHK